MIESSCEESPSRPWMTWLITATILAVYVWQLTGIGFGTDRVGTELAVGPGALAAHRYWTLFTYAWAHAVPLPHQSAYLGFHLVTNLLPLLCVGPVLERWRGPWVFLALYLGAAVASACAWLFFQSDPRGAMIGASGAVFALFTAAGTLGSHLTRVDFVCCEIELNLDLRTAALVLTAVELVQLFFHGLPEVSHLGHLGGALFGVLFVFVFRAAEQALTRVGLLSADGALS